MKLIKNLEQSVSSVLNESITDDAAKLVGIEKEDAEDRIKGLSFANYLELGNAVDIEDVESAREILGTVSPIEEGIFSSAKDVYPGDRVDTPMGNGTVTNIRKTSLDDLRIDVRMDDFRDNEGDIVTFIKSQVELIENIDEADSISEGGGDFGLLTTEEMQGLPTPRLLAYYKAKRKEVKQNTVGADWTAGAEYLDATAKTVETAKAILDTREHIGEDADYIRGRAPSNAKNYLRKGGNKQQFKWRIELNNGKTLLRWADSRKNIDLSPEQHIIGVKSVKKMKVTENASRSFYVSGFPNVRGRHKITAINKEDNGSYDISMGSNGVTYHPDGAKLKFTDNQAKPMTAEWVYNAMNAVSEADNPYAAAPSAGSSIDGMKAASKDTTGTGLDVQARRRTDVDDLNIGDDIEVIDIDGDPTPVTVKNARGPGDTLVVQTDKGEEHIVKKQAVSGTPQLREGRVKEYYWKQAERMTREEFLAKYGEDLGEFWDNINEVGEDPIAHLREMYKDELVGSSAFDGFIGEGLSEEDALALDAAIIKEANLEEGEVSDPVQAGDSIVVRRESTLTGQTKDFEGTVIDYDPNYYDGKVGVAFNDGKEDLRAWYPVNGRLSGRMYDEYVIMPSVDEARQGGKTEHSGAKKGKGGYYGRKKDAKSDSNKNRRNADKKAVNEDGEFYFFIEPDGRGGAEVRSNNGDNHDYFPDIADAKAEADRMNAEYSQVEEGVLEDHVTVKYTDEHGRFIVVTAGAAGYWAVGKGKPYEHGIEQMSYDNVEDAINQADADADDLDNLREMQRRAGIKETASGGATGAGAVAVGAVAVGDMQSRKSGIYGKTTKKPQPKKRTKESADEGIGRGKKE